MSLGYQSGWSGLVVRALTPAMGYCRLVANYTIWWLTRGGSSKAITGILGNVTAVRGNGTRTRTKSFSQYRTVREKGSAQFLVPCGNMRPFPLVVHSEPRALHCSKKITIKNIKI